MNKIINGVASEYDIPMKYENKKMTIFIDTQDMEERYGEELYKEYLEKENQQLKETIKKVNSRNSKQRLANRKLQDKNKQLKDRIKTYEDPEDMTLMYMWCNEKAKDKIKQLKEVIEEIRKIIKTAVPKNNGDYMMIHDDNYKKLLQILDKVRENK